MKKVLLVIGLVSVGTGYAAQAGDEVAGYSRMDESVSASSHEKLGMAKVGSAVNFEALNEHFTNFKKWLSNAWDTVVKTARGGRDLVNLKSRLAQLESGIESKVEEIRAANPQSQTYEEHLVKLVNQNKTALTNVNEVVAAAEVAGKPITELKSEISEIAQNVKQESAKEFKKVNAKLSKLAERTRARVAARKAGAAEVDASFNKLQEDLALGSKPVEFSKPLAPSRPFMPSRPLAPRPVVSEMLAETQSLQHGVDYEPVVGEEHGAYNEGERISPQGKLNATRARSMEKVEGFSIPKHLEATEAAVPAEVRPVDAEPIESDFAKQVRARASTLKKTAPITREAYTAETELASEENPLLEQIRKGKTLKSVKTSVRADEVNVKEPLLSEIAKGKTLRKVSVREPVTVTQLQEDRFTKAGKLAASKAKQQEVVGEVDEFADEPLVKPAAKNKIVMSEERIVVEPVKVKALDPVKAARARENWKRLGTKVKVANRFKSVPKAAPHVII